MNNGYFFGLLDRMISGKMHAQSMLRYVSQRDPRLA